MRIPLFALALLAACQDAAGGLSLGGLADEPVPPPPALVLHADPVVLGGVQELRVEGAAPGETVHVGRSLSGLGPGPCPEVFGGRCLSIRNPVAMHSTVRAGEGGSGRRTLSIPDYPALEGRTACFQAAAIRGPGGADTVLSEPVCAGVGYDADEDGVLDGVDACPGHPDDLDWDGDGVPDGCDDDGAAPRLAPVDWGAPVVSTFGERAVRTHAAAEPVAVVWLLHPEGADGGWFEDPELVVLLRALIDRGHTLVALDSHDRATGGWSTAPPARNPDWRRLLGVIRALRASGALPEGAPVHALGAGGGASFAAWLARHGADGGLPIRSVVLTGDAEVVPSVPALRLVGVQGPPVDGVLRAVPDRLAPTHFARWPGVDVAHSVALFRELVRAGWVDGQGRVAHDDPVAALQALPDLPGLDRGARRALEHVLGLEPLDADHARAVVDFLEGAGASG